MSEVTFDARPPTESALVVGGVAVVGTVALVASPTALALALLGSTLLVGGTVLGSSRVVSLGVVAALGGIVVGATAGVGTLLLLVATAGVLVAWDAALQALDLGETAGREATVGRALSVHVAVAGGVALVAAAGGYAVYLAVGGGRPVGALVLLLAGAVSLAAALR